MITSMRLNHLNTQLLGGMVPLHIIPHLIIKRNFWFGKNIAYQDIVQGNGVALAINNLVDTAVQSSGHFIQGLPTEVMLANGQTFSITAVNNSALSGQAQSVTIDGSYNILVIPEGG